MSELVSEGQDGQEGEKRTGLRKVCTGRRDNKRQSGKRGEGGRKPLT